MVGGVSATVTRQHRLRALPASQGTEIPERGVLHFRRKLPAETMPAAARLCGQLRQGQPPGLTNPGAGAVKSAWPGPREPERPTR